MLIYDDVTCMHLPVVKLIGLPSINMCRSLTGVGPILHSQSGPICIRLPGWIGVVVSTPESR